MQIFALASAREMGKQVVDAHYLLGERKDPKIQDERIVGTLFGREEGYYEARYRDVLGIDIGFNSIYRRNV